MYVQDILQDIAHKLGLFKDILSYVYRSNPLINQYCSSDFGAHLLQGNAKQTDFGEIHGCAIVAPAIGKTRKCFSGLNATYIRFYCPPRRKES